VWTDTVVAPAPAYIVNVASNATKMVFLIDETIEGDPYVNLYESYDSGVTLNYIIACPGNTLTCELLTDNTVHLLVYEGANTLTAYKLDTTAGPYAWSTEDISYDGNTTQFNPGPDNIYLNQMMGSLIAYGTTMVFYSWDLNGTLWVSIYYAIMGSWLTSQRMVLEQNQVFHCFEYESEMAMYEICVDNATGTFSTWRHDLIMSNYTALATGTVGTDPCPNVFGFVSPTRLVGYSNFSAGTYATPAVFYLTEDLVTYSAVTAYATAAVHMMNTQGATTGYFGVRFAGTDEYAVVRLDLAGWTGTVTAVTDYLPIQYKLPKYQGQLYVITTLETSDSAVRFQRSF
jgi:hypothetical protein